MVRMATFIFLMAWVFISSRRVDTHQLFSDSVPVMEVESQSHVDLFKFEGIWFEISHSPSTPLFASVNSVVRYFKVEADRQTITGYYAGAINGTCLPAFKGQIQKFCKDGSADFFGKGISLPSPWGITKFLYTDYQTAVIYYCPALNVNGTCRVNPMASIVSRKKTIDPEVELFLEDLIENKTGIPSESIIPAEYYEDCFPQILAALKKDNGDECVFSNIDVQQDFDPNKFSGKWYPVAVTPRPEREVNQRPLCYHSNGDGSLSVNYDIYKNDQNQTTDHYTIFPKYPSKQTGDFLVDLGVTFRNTYKSYSMFKILYTDYDVAVVTECLGVHEGGSCAPDLSRSAILSRTPEVPANKLEHLKDILINSCVNNTALEYLHLIKNGGCPDDGHLDMKIEESKIPLEEPLAEPVDLPEYSANYVIQTFLGSWFEWTSSPSAVFKPPLAGAVRSHWTLGHGGHLDVRLVMPINGTCIPALVIEVEVLYDEGKQNLYSKSLFTMVGHSSWYATRTVYIDNEFVIYYRCDEAVTCPLKPDALRVVGRTPEHDNATRHRVNSVINGFGINTDDMIWIEHEVDCSHMIFDSEASSKEQPSCHTSRFQVHENFTTTNMEGTWYILAHYSYLNGSESRFKSGALHYRDEGNGSLSGSVSLTSPSGDCLPVIPFKIHPRCRGQDGGDMWTEEDESVFQPGAPLVLSATWKMLYIDEESLVVYNCRQEEEDGTCALEKSRISIMARSFEISDEKRRFLDDKVSTTCIDPYSLINTTSTPGLKFLPNPDGQTTLIRFIKGNPSTYKHYTDHLKDFLKLYETEHQIGEHFIDCRFINDFRPKSEWNKVCRFDLDRDLTSSNLCNKYDDFGYDDGQPCVIIKLDKIYGWLPEAFDSSSLPSALQGRYYNTSVNVRCTGESSSDKDNIGEVLYYPPEGFHFKYFPYLNQPGYRQPIMYARFNSITPGVVVMVTCRAYAKNIVSDCVEETGSVHFELMID